MRVELHPCYILHIRSYKETSLLLEIFSRRYGRVSLIAKGAKRKKCGQANILQIYQKLLLAWVGKNELMTLTDAELQMPCYFQESTQMLSGFYLNELIMQLFHRYEPNLELFIAYEKTLQNLLTPSLIQPALRVFEKKLLKTLGYGLNLEKDIETDLPINLGQTYYYQFNKGPQCSIPKEGGWLKVPGKVLTALNEENFSTPEILNQAKNLMRNILANYLDHKPLASRALYQEYLKKLNSK